jgi:hypothetical protein
MWQAFGMGSFRVVLYPHSLANFNSSMWLCDRISREAGDGPAAAGGPFFIFHLAFLV